MSPRIAEAVVHANEYIVDRYSTPDEAARERRADLTRMMGKDTLEHLQALALTEAQNCVAAAEKSEASGSVWAKNVWDLADAAVRACVELGTPNLLDALKKTAKAA